MRILKSSLTLSLLLGLVLSAVSVDSALAQRGERGGGGGGGRSGERGGGGGDRGARGGGGGSDRGARGGQNRGPSNMNRSQPGRQRPDSGQRGNDSQRRGDASRRGNENRGSVTRDGRERSQGQPSRESRSFTDRNFNDRDFDNRDRNRDGQRTSNYRGDDRGNANRNRGNYSRNNSPFFGNQGAFGNAYVGRRNYNDYGDYGRGFGYGGYRGYGGYGLGYGNYGGYGFLPFLGGLGLGYGLGNAGYGAYGLGYGGYGLGYGAFGPAYGGYYSSYAPQSTYVEETPQTVTADASQPAPPPSDNRGGDFVAMGESAFRAGDYQAAINDFRHALIDEPNNAGLMLMIAQSLFQTGQWTEAAAATELAMGALPEDQWGTVVQHYTELYGDIGDYTRQLKELENAVKQDPDNPALRFLVGYHFGYLNYPEQAVRELGKAVELEGRDPAARRLHDLFAEKIGATKVGPVPQSLGEPRGGTTPQSPAPNEARSSTSS